MNPFRHRKVYVGVTVRFGYGRVVPAREEVPLRRRFRLEPRLVIILVALLTGGCGLLGEAGSGVLVTRQIRVPAEVTRIHVGDAFDAVIRTGRPSPSAAVTIDDNLVDRLRIDLDGDRLSIDLDGQVRDATLRLEIELVGLRELELSGASRATIEGTLTDDVTFGASGASRIDVGAVELDELVAEVSGASEVRIEGTTQHVRAEVSGASTLALAGLETEEAELDVSGASSVEITVLDLLEVEAAGASSVRYDGDPDRVVSDVSGSSSVAPA